MDPIKKAEKKVEEAHNLVRESKLKRIVEMHDKLGKTFQEIGDEFGFQRARAQELYKEGKALKN